MKAQNWTAVGIDFVIVVVGVFIGLQVANWNTARADRIQEREIVLQLIAEANESTTRIDNNTSGDTDRLRAAVRAHDALKAESLSDDDAQALANRRDLSNLLSLKTELEQEVLTNLETARAQSSSLIDELNTLASQG
ncbi:MAG: hypothetical protein AAFX02_09920 [Pseudomonadota bacterium]